MRLVGAYLIGSAAAPVVAVAAIFVAFEGVATGLTVSAIGLVAGSLLLGTVHHATQLDVGWGAVLRSLVWGAGVLLCSVALVCGVGFAWSAAGRPFGGSSTLWWLLCGFAVALVAALFTRGTALPAGVVVTLVVVGAGAAVGVPHSLIGDDTAQSSGLSRSLVYVASPAGYDDGQITTDSPGSTIIYLPVAEAPVANAGTDLMILLTAQEPAPAACGRTERLPFDDFETAGCEELAPDVYYRSTDRFHEVVTVRADVVVTAAGSIDVPRDVLRGAAATARRATDAEVDRLYRGWVLDP